MKVQLFVNIVLWTLIELPVLITSFAAPYEMYQQPLVDSSVFIAYNQSAEIEKHCSTFLTSASELKPDDNRGSKLKNELSFYLGDWEQETDGEPPLMQLHDNGVPESNNQSLTSLLKLVSFEVKDVNSVHLLENTVSLGGILSLGISRNTSFAYGMGLDPGMSPGSSVMVVIFEGVYMETEENGGERLMCLVGSSTSTSSSTDRCDCDDQFSEFSSNYVSTYNIPQTRFLQDDKVVLVLRYPKTFNLTSRAIHGEMVSLNKQGDSRYFGKVHISSQLTSGHSKYQFISELLQSRTSNPPPYQDELMEDGVQMFTGGQFCRVLNHVSVEVLNIVPNYRFSSGGYMSQIIHGKLGPFLLGKEIEATAGGGLTYDHIKLIFQHVKCEKVDDNPSRSNSSAKVSMVIRAVPKGSLQHFERFRTGVSRLTLTAEGIWNSSSGQLLMVACQGTVHLGLEGCDYEIAMYFPRVSSIKQRSFLFGSISNVKKDIGPDNPLFFNAMTGSINEHLPYSYSKIKLLNVFERSSSLSYKILTIVKQSLFRYPALKDEEVEEPLAQLGLLSNTLALNGDAIVDLLIDGRKSRVLIQIEVLALGPLSGLYEPYMDKRNLRKKPSITKDDRFLNVSMRLAFINQKDREQMTYKNVSELSLEGLYDSILGEMHLIGCRRAWVESVGIERGLDCLIEAKIQYPPMNLQWWKNPTAKITISSQRHEDDPLYFSLITLSAHLKYYPDYFQTVINRAFFETILCIMLLIGSVAIIWSQIKVDADTVPYISTSMLAFQILGYSLPLICGSKALFKSSKSEAYKALPRDHPTFGTLKVVECFENVLLLIAILLTARLCQMVLESRSKAHSKGTSKLRSDSKVEKQVMLSSLAIYTFGFLIWLVAAGDNHNVHQHPGKNMHIAPRNGHIIMWQTWVAVIEDFVFVLQDMFLIPQILTNLLMPMPVKSLREAYYLGFTSIRLLVHFFDYLMDPIAHPKVERFESMSPNSTSLMFTQVAAPTTMIMNAVIVYIQQNRKYQKLICTPKQGDM